MNEEKTGDCFEVAGSIVSTYSLGHDHPIPDLCRGAYIGLKVIHYLGITEEAELALVHGMVTRPTDQLRHPHAWVEWLEKGLVLDFSNGHQHLIPRDLYYRAGQISKVFTYSVSSARFELVDHTHYGPWHEELTDA